MATCSLVVDDQRFELDDDVDPVVVHLVMESAMQQGHGDIMLKGGHRLRLNLTGESTYTVLVGADTVA